MRLEDETDVVRRGGVGVECVERLCVLRVGVGVCLLRSSKIFGVNNNNRDVGDTTPLHHRLTLYSDTLYNTTEWNEKVFMIDGYRGALPRRGGNCNDQFPVTCLRGSGQPCYGWADPARCVFLIYVTLPSRRRNGSVQSLVSLAS
jgi:hypothetical protein